MPATCFKRLPRSVGVMAQRYCLSLQGLSETWLALRALSGVRSELCAPEGYKCMHRRPHGVWRRCLRRCACSSQQAC